MSSSSLVDSDFGTGLSSGYVLPSQLHAVYESSRLVGSEARKTAKATPLSSHIW